MVREYGPRRCVKTNSSTVLDLQCFKDFVAHGPPIDQRATSI